jgi:hypothetical protein
MNPTPLIASTTFALLLACAAAPAAAQERTDLAYRTEVSVMYSLLRDYGETTSVGIVMDFGRQVAQLGPWHASVVGEIAFNRFGESSWDETYSHASGAIRFGRLAGSRLRPFAQMLVGVQKAYDFNAINVAPGVGLNVGLHPRLDVKLQLDVPFVKYKGYDPVRQTRFSIGVGVPLGR